MKLQLTAKVSNGEVEKSPEREFYGYGERVELRMHPAPGFQFNGWVVGGVSDSPDQIFAKGETVRTVVGQPAPVGVEGSFVKEEKVVLAEGAKRTDSAVKGVSKAFTAESSENPLVVVMTGDVTVRGDCVVLEPVVAAETPVEEPTVTKKKR